ncbi:MAG: helix-turn-helix domain-containing protein [Nitrososphaeria archaeon]|nr:helix-turn-helix domain-containing protein [Nitrososphaeria archaeon]
MVGKEDSKKLRLIKHPIRKRIIELLGQRENMSFTELKNETNLPVGTLYYHLDVLKGYVLQDEERRYFLSKEGRKLYELVNSYSNTGKDFGRTVFIPSWFFPILERDTLVSIVCFLTVSVLGGIMSYWSGKVLIILHYGVSIFSSIVDATLFPISIISYITYTIILGKLLSSRQVGLGGKLAASIIFAPMIIPLLAQLALNNIPENIFIVLHLSLTIIVQVTSTILGAAYLSSIYGMKFERSLLLQVLFYIISTIVFSFLQVIHLVKEI